jgi:hypothetical protein
MLMLDWKIKNLKLIYLQMNITFYNLYNRQVMQIKLVNSQELSLFYIGELKITACLSHSA